MKEEEVKALLREASEKIKEDFIPAMTNLLKDVFQHGINKGTEIGLKIGTNTPQPNNHCSIPWQTGEPKETAHCLVCTHSGDVKILTWISTIKCWVAYGLEEDYDVIAWCKLSDIEPYKDK